MRADRDAHEEEHAIEVLLPLIAVRQPKLRLAAIVLGGLGFGECEALGAAIARAVAGADGPTLIVASSDMSHYLEDAEARAVDKLALAPLAAADPRGLYDTVRTHGISMCGYIPATVALIAARALGATPRHGRRLRHQRRRRRRPRPRRRLRRHPHRRVTTVRPRQVATRYDPIRTRLSAPAFARARESRQLCRSSPRGLGSCHPP